MSQNVTQNAETAEENAERKKKKKEREEEEEEMEISSSRPRPRQIQAGDTGRTRRSRSHHDPGRSATQVTARRTQVRCGEPRSLRDCLWFFFFFFLLWWTPSSLGFFFFFSFFSDEHVGAALVVFFVFFLNVNRVLETRFPYRRHLEKVLCKRGTTHENWALEARFRSPKSSLWGSSC